MTKMRIVVLILEATLIKGNRRRLKFRLPAIMLQTIQRLTLCIAYIVFLMLARIIHLT